MQRLLIVVLTTIQQPGAGLNARRQGAWVRIHRHAIAVRRHRVAKPDKSTVPMKTLFVLILGCLLASGANAQAYAQLGNPPGDRGNDRIPQLQNGLLPDEQQEQQTAIDRREASDRARQAYPGRVLNVTLSGRRWRVRMDEEGTVFNVFVDADTGTVMRSSE